MLAVRDATSDAREYVRAHVTCDNAHDSGACLCVSLEGMLIVMSCIVMIAAAFPSLF